MKATLLFLAVIPAALFAQDTAQQVTKFRTELDAVAQFKVLNISGSAAGNVVKGAPYSATEVNEHNQLLADGTKIHAQSESLVFRDSEGRVRRETDGQVTVWDPVAQTSYTWSAKSPIATKLAYFSSGMAKSMTVTKTTTTFSGDAALLDKKKAEAEALAGLQTFTYRTEKTKTTGKDENLGQQNMEGLAVEGKRSKSVIEVNSIGNDRPIELINERWYSAELQTNVMTKRVDPRSGEDIFRLTNVSRSEPSPAMFQVPAGYTINPAK